MVSCSQGQLMCILLFQKECLKLLQVFIYGVHVNENCVDLYLPVSLDSLAYESILLVTVDVLEIQYLIEQVTDQVIRRICPSFD